jgi:hypothetical protein
MHLLGEYLVDEGMLAPDDLERALRIQRRRGGRLGPILAALGLLTQDQVDAAWAKSFILPLVEQAIDRSCSNRFTRQLDRGLRCIRVHRKEYFVEDMLAGCAIHDAGVSVDGTAVMRVGSLQSLPIEFSIDLDRGFAVLDDNSEAIVRRWIAMVERRQIDKGEQSGEERPAA